MFRLVHVVANFLAIVLVDSAARSSDALPDIAADVSTAQRVRTTTDHAVSLVRGYLVSGDDHMRAVYDGVELDLRASLLALPVSPETEELEHDIVDYLGVARRAFELREQRDFDGVRQLFARALEPRYEAIEADFRWLLGRRQAELDDHVGVSRHESQLALYTVAASILVLLASWLVPVLRRRRSVELARAVAALGRVEQELRRSPEELDELAAALHEATRAVEALRARRAMRV